MKRRRKSIAFAVAAQALAALLCVASGLPAQPAAQAQAVKQEVTGYPAQLEPPAPPVQPIPYSHKKHLALGLQCQFCHANPEPRDLMTFPATSRCMGCHATIAKNKPAIRKLAQFAKSGETIPWVRVYVIPSFVRWSHRTHVDAGVKCEVCHGLMAQMDVTAQATVVTSMFGCIHCHEMREAKTGCDTCHH